ncbi:MAG: DUF6473 family protein [Pseudomonadota bacterium]
MDFVRFQGKNCFFSIVSMVTGQPEVGFRQFSHVAGMLSALKALDAERLRLVEREIRTAWVARMSRLMDEIHVPIILLWIATRRPEDRPGRAEDPWRYPHFIDRDLLEAVVPKAAALIECTADDGLPQDLTRGGRPVLFQPTGTPILANGDLPSPLVHRRAADSLVSVIRHVIG